MDFFAARLVDHDVGDKRDELGGGVPLSGLAQHLAGLGEQSGRHSRRCLIGVGGNLRAQPTHYTETARLRQKVRAPTAFRIKLGTR